MTTSMMQSLDIPLTSLYVGDLHPKVSETTLYAKFSQVGNLLGVRICRDVGSKDSLGYGYVNFTDPRDAERALETMNYDMLEGRPIRIMWSQRDPSLRKSGKGNVFIKNLDKSIEQKELYDTFIYFGKILSCKIATDDHGNSKGYGFVHFETEEAAKSAIESVNHMMIRDRIVYVGNFVPASERKPKGSRQKFNNCYVKNFGPDMDNEKLHSLFSEFGEIKSAVVMKDEQGKSKGFGFVCFHNPDNAETAVRAMHNKEMDNRQIYVSRAQRKEERQEELKQRAEKQKQERQSKYEKGVNLYVKNLDDAVDDEQLRNAFAKFGSITSAKVMLDANRRSRGFGFVCFQQPEGATRAVSEMNGSVIGSKPLYVAIAQRKEDRRMRLLAEHHQRTYNRGGINPLIAPAAAHAGANFFAPAAYAQHPRFIPQILSQPKWNRPTSALQPANLSTAHHNLGAARTASLTSHFSIPPPPGPAPAGLPHGQLNPAVVYSAATVSGVGIGPAFRQQPPGPQNAPAQNSATMSAMASRALLPPGAGAAGPGGVVPPLDAMVAAHRQQQQQAQVQQQHQAAAAAVAAAQQQRAVASAGLAVAQGGPRGPPGVPQSLGLTLQQQQAMMNSAKPTMAAVAAAPAPGATRMSANQLSQARPMGQPGGIPGSNQLGVKFNQTARNVMPAQGAGQPGGSHAHVPGAPHASHHVAGVQQGTASGGASAGHLVAGSHHNQLTMAKLASLNEDSQRDFLGNRLYPLVHSYSPDNASKITGMLLEMDSSDVIHMLESENALKDKLDEALAMLQGRANTGQNTTTPAGGSAGEVANAGGDSSKAGNSGTSSVSSGTAAPGSAPVAGSKEAVVSGGVTTTGKPGKQAEAK